MFNRLNEKMAQYQKPRQTWWSLGRLNEHGISFGESANKKTRRTATKFNTQKLVEVVTPQVLSLILRRG